MEISKKKNRPGEYISIEYTGVVDEEEEHSSKELEEEWLGGLENYTFNEVDGSTELLIEVDVPDEYVNEFKELWPLALKDLKKLVEES